MRPLRHEPPPECSENVERKELQVGLQAGLRALLSAMPSPECSENVKRAELRVRCRLWALLSAHAPPTMLRKR